MQIEPSGRWLGGEVPHEHEYVALSIPVAGLEALSVVALEQLLQSGLHLWSIQPYIGQNDDGCVLVQPLGGRRGQTLFSEGIKQREPLAGFRSLFHWRHGQDIYTELF